MFDEISRLPTCNEQLCHCHWMGIAEAAPVTLHPYINYHYSLFTSHMTPNEQMSPLITCAQKIISFVAVVVLFVCLFLLF